MRAPVICRFVILTWCATFLPNMAAAESSPSLRELGRVWRADFDADATRLIVQLRNGELGLWDCDTGQSISGEIGTLTTKGTYVIDASARRALVGFEGGGARVFDLATGLAMSPLLDLAFKGSWHLPAGFSPDGSRVYVFEMSGECRVLEVATGKTLATFTLPPASDGREIEPRIEFLKEGATAVLLDPTGTLRRYDTRTWQESGRSLPHPDREAYHVDFAVCQDADHAVTFDSPGENGPDGQLQLWDLATSSPLGKPLRAKNGISGRFINGGERLLIAPGRGETRVVKVPSLEPDFSLPRHDDVEASRAAITANGSHLISWGYNSTVRSMDARTGEHAGSFSNKAQVTELLTGPGSIWLAFDNTAFLLEKHYDSYIVRFDPGEMRPLATLRVTGYLHRMVLSPDASRLMIHEGTTDKERIRLFDAATLVELPSTLAR